MEQTHSLSDEKMENKKTLEKAKHIFTDPSSVLFSEEKINNRLLEKKKKNKIWNGLFAFNAFNEHFAFNNKEKIPTRAENVDKREIDRSTLCSFNGPF